MSPRREFIRIFFVLTAFGIISALAMLSNPRLESVRAVDMVHLLGTGMCFGAAIVALVFYLRTPKSP